MAKANTKRTKDLNGNANKFGKGEATGQRPKSKSLGFFLAGVKDYKDFNRAFSALLGDVASGAIVPTKCNSICNVGAKMLRATEMAYRLGMIDKKTKQQTLTLVT